VPARRTLEESFWPKVDCRGPDECWPWLSTRNGKGYGSVARIQKGVKRVYQATHIAWAIANGRPFPAGRVACHSCDNPPCVNPAHIWPGTHADNQQDKRLKGRARLDVCRLGLHRMEGDNLKLERNGGRRCRSCFRAYVRPSRRRNP
jgi:hypothetical protein